MALLLEMKDLGFEFLVSGRQPLRLLDQVNLSVQEDELVAVLGPSGSGKSTLVRLASGLLAPSSGSVLYRGEPMQGVHPGVGVVLQSSALFPWMSVQENIALGLEKLGLVPEKRADAVAWAVDRLGLAGYEEAYPRELAQGLKVRVSLARALAPQPELLILDDPFSGVDVLTAESLRAELLALWQNNDVNPKSILFVTHNIPEIVELANRVLVLSGSPARLKVEVANPLSYPRDTNSSEFFDKVSQIHDLITKDVLPDEAVVGRFEVRMAPLPRAEIGQIIGLLEALNDAGGKFDVFDFVSETRKEYSSVLMIVNAAEMLDLVKTPKDQVELTEPGRQFLLSDVNKRKMLVNLQLQKMLLVRKLMDMMTRARDRVLSKEQLVEEFTLLFPSENPFRQLNTMVAWLRFAELCGFSSRRGHLYLDRVFSVVDGQVQEVKNPRPVLPKEPKAAGGNGAEPAAQEPSSLPPSLVSPPSLLPAVPVEGREGDAPQGGKG